MPGIPNFVSFDPTSLRPVGFFAILLLACDAGAAAAQSLGRMDLPEPEAAAFASALGLQPALSAEINVDLLPDFFAKAKVMGHYSNGGSQYRYQAFVGAPSSRITVLGGRAGKLYNAMVGVREQIGMGAGEVRSRKLELPSLGIQCYHSARGWNPYTCNIRIGR